VVEHLVNLSNPDMGILNERQARRLLETARERDPHHWALYLQALVLVKGRFKFGYPKTIQSEEKMRLGVPKDHDLAFLFGNPKTTKE
jgi:hypothetical protein